MQSNQARRPSNQSDQDGKGQEGENQNRNRNDQPQMSLQEIEKKVTELRERGHDQFDEGDMDWINDQLDRYPGVSAKIRFLHSLGFPTGTISRLLTVKMADERQGKPVIYQHVRNVLNTPVSENSRQGMGGRRPMITDPREKGLLQRFAQNGPRATEAAKQIGAVGNDDNNSNNGNKGNNAEDNNRGTKDTKDNNGERARESA